jgi:ABC-type polysaccharide/polyol phosphate export permease
MTRRPAPCYHPAAMPTPFYTNAQQYRLARIVPDLVRHRYLLRDLVWKDIRARYRFAVMGFLWAVIEPLLMMLVLTFVFSTLFLDRIDTGIESGRHYAAFVLCGLIPWQFFASSLTSATRSLVDNRELVKKVYFPREVIPLSAIGVAFVNFCIGLVLLLIISTLLVGRVPGIGIFYFIPIFAIQLALIAGLALLFSVGHAYFRDVGYIVEAAVLFGFYATPVIYPPEMIANAYPSLANLYYANPMAGLLTAYRSALFDNALVPLTTLAWPALAAVLLLALGAATFRKFSPVLADHL